MSKPKRITFVFLVVIAFLVITPLLLAQEAAQIKAGMDPERLASIPARMKAFVDEGKIAGAVMLVARHGEVALLEAVGYQDLESKKPMRTDTIFGIRSMQKSITAVGIMILVEEGRLTLADPVEKHLPEFRDEVVIDKADGDKVLRTKKPSRPITIRDLLAHTSGVPGEPYRGPLRSWREEFFKKRTREWTLAELVAHYAREPLEFEPGTRFLYSDLGFAILARLIEVASSQASHDFLEERIFRPLGMRETFSVVPPGKDGRIASAYTLENGQLTSIAISKSVGDRPYGGFSTATDMFAFYQMMLNGGTYNGRRILSWASVELMTQMHADVDRTPGFPDRKPGNEPRPGRGYGLGWFVRGELAAPPVNLQSAGTYAHGGYLGTFGWVDPKKDLVGILMMHRRPTPDPERATFIAMAAAAIAEDEKPKPRKNGAGMDPERLARIPARMQEFVDSGTIAGAVTLVARQGKVVSLEAVGYQHLETKTPMRTDSIFQIRSMTKPITAVGIMILLEEGRLLLSDPVAKFVPEFREQLLVGKREGDKILPTKKPSRPITMRDLLTHTSGMPKDPSSDKPSKTLAESVATLSQEQLQFEPGAKFSYSNAGFDTLGRIIEVASGQPYEEFIEQRILRPLGMKGSFFLPPPEKCNRIVSHYEPRNGKLKRFEGELNPDWQSPDGCRSFAAVVQYPGPSWGMFSTASDMAAFHQMMLNGGTHKGVRILSPASVEAMTAVHAGDDLVGGPWWGYGLGWFVLRKPRGDKLSLLPAGVYSHEGLRGTFGWVDPAKDFVGIFMIQLESDEGQDSVRNTFIAMTYAAIVD